ncbi:hypothetical protein NDN08_003264 [Rhodosorus marinus]|uniref:BRCT domain-containing protein n=1 Tax=Rhodosorus marinus TaxID=101924 RepID=A0AAV8UYQ9_9RHOD|nr:hypothetical protein NDN08_003264 [Rhodosorus marinus]
MDKPRTPFFSKKPSRRAGLIKLKIFLTDSVANEDMRQLIQTAGGDVQEGITDDTDVILVDENVILDPNVFGIERMEKVISSRWIESCLSEGKLLPAADFAPSWMRVYEGVLGDQVAVRRKVDGELQQLEQNIKGPNNGGVNALKVAPIRDRLNESGLVLKPGAERLLSATVGGKIDSEGRQTRSQASARSSIAEAKEPNGSLGGHPSLGRSLVDMAVHTIGAAGILKKIRPNKLETEGDRADLDEQVHGELKGSVHLTETTLNPRNESNEAARNSLLAEHEASQSGTATNSEMASTGPRSKRGEGPAAFAVSGLTEGEAGNILLDTKTEAAQNDVTEKGSVNEDREPAPAAEASVTQANPGLVDEQVHVPKTRSQTKEGARKNAYEDVRSNHTSQGEKTKGRNETVEGDEGPDGVNHGQVPPPKMTRLQSEKVLGPENLAGGKDSQVSRISARRRSASEDKTGTARSNPVGDRPGGNTSRGRYSLRQVSAREETSRTQATSEIESTDDEAEEDDSYDAALETEEDEELESNPEEPQRGGQAASKRSRGDEEFETTRSEYLVKYRKRSRVEETPTQKAVRYLEGLYGAETDLNRRKARYYAFRALYESCKDGARLSVKRASKLIWKFKRREMSSALSFEK